MGTELHDEVAGFEPEGETERFIGFERVSFRARDRSKFPTGRHLVQVDEELSVSSPRSDNVTVPVVSALPTLHGYPFLIGRNSLVLKRNKRPLRAGFSKQLAFKKDTFFG